MRDDDSDLSFAEFGGPKRLYPAPGLENNATEAPNYLDSMARREGLAIRLRRIALRGRRPLREPPTLRFEAESEPEEEQ